MGRIASILLAILALGWTSPALAQVELSFHSFNGSVIVGRYPHAFIVLEGTLEETGEAVSENYGFTAKKVSPAILSGPVFHEISVEKPKYLKKTNRHFSIRISDTQYRKVVAEMQKWRDAPGKFYDLDTRNCIVSTQHAKGYDQGEKEAELQVPRFDRWPAFGRAQWWPRQLAAEDQGRQAFGARAQGKARAEEGRRSRLIVARKGMTEIKGVQG